MSAHPLTKSRKSADRADLSDINNTRVVHVVANFTDPLLSILKFSEMFFKFSYRTRNEMRVDGRFTFGEISTM